MKYRIKKKKVKLLNITDMSELEDKFPCVTSQGILLWSMMQLNYDYHVCDRKSRAFFSQKLQKINRATQRYNSLLILVLTILFLNQGIKIAERFFSELNYIWSLIKSGWQTKSASASRLNLSRTMFLSRANLSDSIKHRPIMSLLQPLI